MRQEVEGQGKRETPPENIQFYSEPITTDIKDDEQREKQLQTLSGHDMSTILTSHFDKHVQRSMASHRLQTRSISSKNEPEPISPLMLKKLVADTFSNEPDQYQEYSRLKFRNIIYELNQDVFIQNADDPSQDLIARILKIIKLDLEISERLVVVQWQKNTSQHRYYRKRSLPKMYKREKQFFSDNELFLTDLWDVIRVDCINGSCKILTYDDYIKNLSDDDCVFYSRAIFSTKDNKIIPDVSSWPCDCVCNKPPNPDLPYIQCDSCQKWLHLKCAKVTSREANELGIYECQTCKIKPETSEATPKGENDVLPFTMGDIAVAESIVCSDSQKQPVRTILSQTESHEEAIAIDAEAIAIDAEAIAIDAEAIAIDVEAITIDAEPKDDEKTSSDDQRRNTTYYQQIDVVSNPEIMMDMGENTSIQDTEIPESRINRDKNQKERKEVIIEARGKRRARQRKKEELVYAIDWNHINRYDYDDLSDRSGGESEEFIQDRIKAREDIQKLTGKLNAWKKEGRRIQKVNRDAKLKVKRVTQERTITPP